MYKKKLIKLSTVLVVCLLFGGGLIFAQSLNKNIFSQVNVEANSKSKTEINKTILKERLRKKKVGFIENANDNRPNPLVLKLKIINDDGVQKYELNNKSFNKDELIQKLKIVSSARKKSKVLLENSNTVDMTITLAGEDENISYYRQNQIFVEDFEELVEALQAKGFKQILVELSS